jgi:hypothetical protein
MGNQRLVELPANVALNLIILRDDLSVARKIEIALRFWCRRWAVLRMILSLVGFIPQRFRDFSTFWASSISPSYWSTAIDALKVPGVHTSHLRDDPPCRSLVSKQATGRIRG